MWATVSVSSYRALRHLLTPLPNIALKGLEIICNLKVELYFLLDINKAI